MDSREKEIAFLDAELAECRGRLQQELIAIGGAVLAVAAGAVADAELAGRLEEARALKLRVEQARDLIVQVQTRSERVGAIEAIARGNDQRVKDAMREVEHRYRDIGATAAQVYKDKCPEKERFREVFQPLLVLEEELGRLAKEIERLEQERQKKGFFSKMMDRSKILLVEAKMRYREMDRAGILEEIGRRVCASKFPESVSDPAFAEMMGKIDVNRKRAIEIQEETAKLRTEQARLEEELRGLGVTGEAIRRVKELEHEIEEADRKLRDGQSAIGTLCCDRNLAEPIAGADLAPRLKTVRELREMVDGKGARVDRIRSAMDLDRRTGELNGLYTQRATLEILLKETQNKLAALEAEIAKQAANADDLRRRAGTEAAPAAGEPRKA